MRNKYCNKESNSVLDNKNYHGLTELSLDIWLDENVHAFDTYVIVIFIFSEDYGLIWSMET